MQISCTGVGKKYNREWIFRGFSFVFENDGSYAVTGANGSGKSTLLQILNGSLQQSCGKIVWKSISGKTLTDNLYTEISFTAPYLELIEEFHPLELLRFHCKFRKMVNNMRPMDVLHRCMLDKEKGTEIRAFSSGMRQRLRLALALYTQSELLLLDEPTSNLDRAGIEWYLKEVQEFSVGRTLIIASNETRDHDFCRQTISLSDWKN